MQFFHVFVNFVDVFAVYQKGFVRFACYVFPYVITTHGKYFVIDSYSYVCLFVCFWRNSPQWVRASSLMRFLDHTLRTTVGRTPLGE